MSSLFPLNSSDTEGLVRHTDLAVYAATKDGGKDRDVLYERAMELEQRRLQAKREHIAQVLVQSRCACCFHRLSTSTVCHAPTAWPAWRP